MKRAFGIMFLCAASAFAAGSENLTQAQIDDIIRKFTSKESEFALARGAYTYHQTARVQDLDRNGREVGRWEEVADIVFTPEGKRTEKVVSAPIPTLQNFTLGPEDLADIRDIQPFVLTTETLPKYHVRYLGKEKLDELDCYAFAVKPKNMVKGERYFSGIVWVDDLDIQVVKSYGRAVGIVKEGQAFPKFETYRDKIDGKYWFPIYTIAEDTLYFENRGQTTTAQIRQVIKYENYKRFQAESRIIDATELDGTEIDVPSEEEKPAPVSPGGLPPPPYKSK